jgi:hypothetical protein
MEGYKGSHQTKLLWYKRFPSFPSPDAVWVSQSVGDDSLGIALQVGPSAGPPKGPTVAEARALGGALLAAVALVEAEMPGRCSDCGEPVPASSQFCARHELERSKLERAERRSRMRIVSK